MGLNGERLFLMLFIREFSNPACGESSEFAAKTAVPLDRKIARTVEISNDNLFTVINTLEL